jgi:hypothetical protein
MVMGSDYDKYGGLSIHETYISYPKWQLEIFSSSQHNPFRLLYLLPEHRFQPAPVSGLFSWRQAFGPDMTVSTAPDVILSLARNSMHKQSLRKAGFRFFC